MVLVRSHSILRQRKIFLIVTVCILGFFLFFLLQTAGRLIRLEWLRWLVIPLIIGFILNKKEEKRLPISLLPLCVVAVILCLFLVSSAPLSHHFIFIRWYESSYLKAGVVRWAILSSFFIILIRYKSFRRALPFILILLIVIIQIETFAIILRYSKGLPFYRDDHPSFMHRLFCLSKSLPRTHYYDPEWNGGVYSTASIGSGLVPVSLLAWPFLQFISVEKLYTPFVAIVFIVILPWISAFSMLFIKKDWNVAAFSVFLIMTSSWFHYLFLFHFGTIGALFSTYFVIPLICSLYRMIIIEAFNFWTLSVFILSSIIVGSWPGNIGIIFVTGLSILPWIKKMSFRKLILLMMAGCFIALALLFLYLPVFKARMGTIEKVIVSKNISWGALTKRGCERISDLLAGINPILLYFGVAGSVLIKRRYLRYFIIIFIISTIFVMGFISEIYPDLQLYRSCIPLSIVLAIPATLNIMRILRANGITVLKSCLLGLLVLSGYYVLPIAKSYASTDLIFMSDRVNELILWIKENVPKHNRILFAGKCVHAYGGGHIASLPFMTGREMMACDYYHVPPFLVEYDYPPSRWRINHDSVYNFLKLYNVGYVVTYHDRWKKFFGSDPRYKEVYSIYQKKSIITIFKSFIEEGLITGGNEKVISDINKINIKISSGTTNVILRYNWIDGLKCEGGRVYPIDMGNGLKFIGMDIDYGCTNVVIRF